VMVRFLFTGFSSDALQLGFLVLQEMPINVVVTKRLKDNAPFLVFIVSNFAVERSACKCYVIPCRLAVCLILTLSLITSLIQLEGILMICCMLL